MDPIPRGMREKPGRGRGAITSTEVNARPGSVMSRPRFLADHDLNEHIVDGVLRREPAIEFIRAREIGLHIGPDLEILEHALSKGLSLFPTMSTRCPDMRAPVLPLAAPSPAYSWFHRRIQSGRSSKTW